MNSPSVSVIIPALNEEQSIPFVLKELYSIAGLNIPEVIVVDNGSTDETARIAEDFGAIVLSETKRGYGAACLKGLERIFNSSNPPDLVAFMDADYSDSPSELPLLVETFNKRNVDLVIGSRTLGNAEMGSLTPVQRFGNRLSTTLIRILYGVSFTDLGPFRVIRSASLKKLNMQDRNFGWTAEMQIKAARQGLRCIEVPVSYKKRIGVSKISGTVRGSILAGWKILYTIGKLSLSK
ncbi:glycosyltransferase family 2 protein [Leptospira alstonii]|uniref:Glycosyltransferase, group 2 family protein n=2 Tax=Leptospira alstonii TaxID=28452 RepID=M6CZC7_9LEPT|nr:glycosyltransferase family 2 protein [Leptospira alstonii]EMJ95836.1 glycosyltransferase, group 2 family protein [Leptospira alstonii serovar Sichuan str. 79601]EQA79531.1 glycosyltransferase, group 2 family protein [Leptospira alstonii serovar Pingchang str. 80-412]